MSHRSSAAEETLRRAKQLQEQSRNQAEAGQHGKAFLSARDAWQLVQQFPEHEACNALAEELLQEMNALAEKANQQYPGASTDPEKPLIVK